MIVFVVDLPAMQRFYRDLLGLAPIDEDPAFARYDAGGTVIALHPVPAEVVGPVGARRDDTCVKYAFHADDVNAEVARLRSLGVAMDEVRRFGTVAFCDGVDPEGNVFQISSR